MGSAADSPQNEPSADTEASPGAAHPGTPAAASRGGGPPTPEAPSLTTAASLLAASGEAPSAAASPVPRASSPGPEAAAPGTPSPGRAASSPLAADPSPPAVASDPGPLSPTGDDSQLALDGLAADLASESLGALAAEPPGATAEQLREEAFNAAWRFIARRERTEAEVRARLERNDVEPPIIDEVLDELRTSGYVDDAGYATRFAEDRRNLDGWGGERIERRLRELGVDRRHIAAALAAGEHDELAAATALLARRYPIPPDTPRDREKALGFLVRKGFELELAHDALRRHAASAV